MAQQTEASVIVPVDIDTAFALAHTLGNDRTAWDTQVERRMLIRDHRRVQRGAQVFERVDNRRRVIVEYDSWFPPQQSSTRLLKGPFWLAEYGEGWHFSPAEAGTRVTLKLTWRHSAPLFAEAAARTLKQAFTAEVQQRLADLLAACEDASFVERVRARDTAGELPPNARHRDQTHRSGTP